MNRNGMVIENDYTISKLNWMTF